MSPKHEPPQDDCALYRIVILHVHNCKEGTLWDAKLWVAFLGFSRLSRLLMAEIRREHHLGCLKIPVNDGISIGLTTNLNWFIIKLSGFQKSHQQLLRNRRRSFNMIRSPDRNFTMSVISRPRSMKRLASNFQIMWRWLSGVDEVDEPTKKMSGRITEDVFSGKYFFGNKTNLHKVL